MIKERISSQTYSTLTSSSRSLKASPSQLPPQIGNFGELTAIGARKTTSVDCVSLCEIRSSSVREVGEFECSGKGIELMSVVEEK